MTNPDLPFKIPRKPKRAPSVRGRLPPEQLLPYDEMTCFATARGVELVKLDRITGLLWIPPKQDFAKTEAQMVAAVDLLNSLKPDSGAEMMLAEQMVGIHLAAIECLRRAMMQTISPDRRDAELSHAQRLTGVYARQLAALDKHRGKSEQKVTVEHVHVAAGGQAIVGNIERGSEPVPVGRRKVAPPQIAHQVAPPNPLDALTAARTAPKKPIEKTLHD